MKSMVSFVAAACGLLFVSPFTNSAEKNNADSQWTTMTVPGLWEEQSPGKLSRYDGFAWYRCYVLVPENWKGRELKLAVEAVDNVHEAFFNGVKVGGRGSLPPKYKSGLSSKRDEYPVPPTAVVAGEYNVVAIRVYDHDGQGGFQGAAPALISGDRGILLGGKWEFRTGDRLQWAKRPEVLKPTGAASFSKQVSADSIGQVTANTASNSGALSPAESLKTFTVPGDLELVQVLAEPIVRQPVFINFDERGRMWVVQYIQYPYPEGLKMVSRDTYWRAVYDKVPLPPPNHIRGHDKITIHEDSNGDGLFDTHKTFIEGLNIATSCTKGRGGVWVLNPPYLLFYPDKNNDDVPDGDPVVHLQGFGLEDTHSVVNSLRWGPDGWLYACQGSTVSGNVMRPGLDKQVVHSMGQAVWRYHPETRRYEIFAEGGGNAFGLEIDEQGRIYSGHNGGDSRGFHYVQGGYFRKGFGKHGPLSNPYAFGYFQSMGHHKVQRFTHNFVLYDGGTLPQQYHGKLFGVEPLQGRVVQSLVEPDRSSFKTTDLNRPITSTDKRFRPVEIKVGPDGAIYVADMYEPLISHRQHFEGQIDKTNGRIYRLQATGAEPLKPFDLGNRSTAELIELLDHPNKWFRQTALRLMADRRDRSAIPLLRKMIADNHPRSLEALWALNLSGGLDEQFALQTLGHDDPQTRLWTVRLLCDEQRVPPSIAAKLAEMAEIEPYVHVRSQLACSAKRLPATDALPLVRNLLRHDEDAADIHLPLLLWWAVESKCENDRDAVLAMFSDKQIWRWPMVEQHILERLMRRFALAGSRKDLVACARLLLLSPDVDKTNQLLRGFEQAFKGRSLAGLPPELVAALAKAGGGSLTLRIRQNDAAAIDEALKVIADGKADQGQRVEYVQTLGEIGQPRCVPVLLDVLQSTSDDLLRSGILTSLQAYSDRQIGATVVGLYGKFSPDVQTVAQTLLASRKTWTSQLLAAVDAGRVDHKSIPLDTVHKMTIHRDDRIAALIKKHWTNIRGASSVQMQQRIADVSEWLNSESHSSDPYNGKKLYMQSCGKCHILFGEGGRIGPDLTTYNRDDTVRVLLNVVNPSAEIREGFESYVIITEDGRTATGFLYDQDNRVVVLRGVDGQNITFARDKIEEMLRQKKSLMPEGLLKDLKEQQIRDLFAYLRTAQPLNNR